MKVLAFLILLLIPTVIWSQDVPGQIRSEFEKRNSQIVIDLVNSYLSDNAIIDSVEVELRLLKAASFQRLRNFDSSFYAYYEIYEKFPSDLSASIQLGYRYGESGHYDNAFFFLENARKYHPQDALAAVSLSYYHGLAENYNAAISYADTALNFATDSIWIGSAWSNRSYANLALGNTQKSMEEIEISLKYFENNSYAYRNLGLVLLKQKKIDDACKAFYRAEELGGVNIVAELKREFCVE